MPHPGLREQCHTLALKSSATPWLESQEASIFCHRNFDLGLRTEMADPILKLAFHKRSPQIKIIHFNGLEVSSKTK